MTSTPGPILASAADAGAIAALLHAFNTEFDVPTPGEVVLRERLLTHLAGDADDVDAQRFYQRHGFTAADTDTGEQAFYYSGPARWPTVDSEELEIADGRLDGGGTLGR